VRRITPFGLYQSGLQVSKELIDRGQFITVWRVSSA
jgi:hypothetical protein